MVINKKADRAYPSHTIIAYELQNWSVQKLIIATTISVIINDGIPSL
jgi:hypothetical protein